MRFIRKVQNFSSQYHLWNKGSKIIVGVSGGPDSVCLLDLLYYLSKKFDFELQIAHVNYGLRGQDSIEDEEFVRKLGRKYGLKVNILKGDKKSYIGNVENSLRDIRYRYFEKLRKSSNFDFIAVAHNQNDQAETVLMRVIRGSGLNGLSAMRPKSSKIIRPLLQTARKEIIAYLNEKELSYRVDKTNDQVDIFRNKLRHETIPSFEKEFNHSFVKTMGGLSFSVADDYDFISKHAERFLASVCMDKKAGFLESEFFNLHTAIQRQVLRLIFSSLSGGLGDIEYGQIEEIRKVIKSAKSKTKICAINGLKISKKGDRIEIFR